MFKSNLFKVIPSFFKGEEENNSNAKPNEFYEKKLDNKESSPLDMIKHITQSYNLTHLRYKLRAADVVLAQLHSAKTLVFCSRKRDKVLLDRFLSKLGYKIEVIDNYAQNTQPVEQVEGEAEKQIIITSDGVDVSFLRGQVDAVLHFDMPPKPSDYLTRLVMVFGSESDERKPAKSHLIATMREFSALQILQSNYPFDVEELKFDDAILPNDEMHHHEHVLFHDEANDVSQPAAHYRQSNSAPSALPNALYDSRDPYASRIPGPRSSQTGFEENPPAFFKVK